MKKILISLVIISLIIGAASGLPKLGANQGFSNPGSVELGGDLTVGGNLAVDGGARIDETLTVNALAVNTTTTLNGNTDTGSGDYLNVTTADKLTVGGVIVPTAIPIASFPYTASSVDQGVFTASGAWTLTAVKMTPRVVGSSGSAVTVMVKICDSGEAPASGDNMLSGTLDLKGTADTPQSGTVSAGTIANGKIVALDFTGDLTAAVGVVTLYGTRA